MTDYPPWDELGSYSEMSKDTPIEPKPSEKSLDEAMEHFEKLKRENKNLTRYVNSLIKEKEKLSKEINKLYEYKQKEEDREEFFKVYASLSTEDRKFTRSFIRSLSDRRTYSKRRRGKNT